MFDPTTETDPDFDLEIREDVREEVSAHGTLNHIYVDKQAKDGKICLKFADAGTAEKAYQHLHGRNLFFLLLFQVVLEGKRYYFEPVMLYFSTESSFNKECSQNINWLRFRF